MPSTPYSQQLTDLLPLKIRSAGDPAGPTTAEDHRAFEALEIEAIAFLEALTRGNRIFVAELFDNPPEVPADVQEGDLCLDRTGNLPLWGWVDGEWVALGDLVGADGAKILGGAGAPNPATGTIGDWYFRYNVAAYEKTGGGWVNRFGLGAGAALPDQSGNAGKVLGTDGTVAGWVAAPNGLPSQSGQTGKVLGTDGSAASWVAAPSGLPAQAGNAGRILRTDGTTATWSDPLGSRATPWSARNYIQYELAEAGGGLFRAKAAFASSTSPILDSAWATYWDMVSLPLAIVALDNPTATTPAAEVTWNGLQEAYWKLRNGGNKNIILPASFVEGPMRMLHVETDNNTGNNLTFVVPGGYTKYVLRGVVTDPSPSANGRTSYTVSRRGTEFRITVGPNYQLQA